MIAETIKDYEKEIVASTIGVRQGFFEGSVDGAKSIGDAFDEMAKWVDEYYS
jgi:CRISPR-associated protein Cst2